MAHTEPELSFLPVSSLDKELGLAWTDAQVVNGSRLRHPSGAEMEAVHFGTRQAPIFSLLHRPPGPPRGVIVVCSPPYAEAARNQRREILFGWLASDRNLAVIRFHPRGGGHSGGDTSEMSLHTMLEDAQAVANEGMERLEAPLIGFVGARLGAVVAHRAAMTHTGTAVAWWQPVLDAHSYVRELFRAAMIGALKRGVATSGRELESRLKEDGVLDVLGSPVSRSFHESLFSSPLDDVPSGPRDGLVVQMSRHSQVERHYESLVGKLREDRWVVDTVLIPDEETWWFGARGRDAELALRTVALAVVPTTVEFFQSTAMVASK